MVFGRGKKGKSGLEQQSSTIGYVIKIIAPFYLLTFVVEMFAPPNIELWLFAVGLICWIAYIQTYQTTRQGEAARHLSLPASLWRFTPTDKRNYDIFIPEGGLKKIGMKHIQAVISKVKENIKESNKNPSTPTVDWEKSFVPYFMTFTPYIEWKGRIFNEARALFPAEWEETCSFTPGGEVWWKDTPVFHPKAEGIVFHVLAWDEIKGRPIPVVLVADSTWHYQHNLERVKINNPGGDLTSTVLLAMVGDYQGRLIAKEEENTVLRKHLYGKLEGDKIDKDFTDKRISGIFNRIGIILDYKGSLPLRDRIKSWKTVGVVAFLLITVIILFKVFGGK